jgi:RNA polymerase sigma factor (TIGR02999 family)
MEFQMSNVTQILTEIQSGNETAAADLLPLVYAELRKLAHARLGRESSEQTLQPTSLVHEAYLRLIGEVEVRWDSRAHFFAAAAEAMRRILIENARHRKSLKRGGALSQRTLSDGDAIADMADIDTLLDLDSALIKLAKEEPDMARLVELRYFAGLNVEEAAQVLGVSARTVKRNWSFARAWLGRELNAEPS